MPNQIDTNHANNLVNTQTETKNTSMENNNQELASGFTQIKVKKNFSILNPLIDLSSTKFIVSPFVKTT